MRARVAEQEEGGEGDKACVGICYYNKLVALEAKEDLTRHNEVYKQVGAEGQGIRVELQHPAFRMLCRMSSAQVASVDSVKTERIQWKIQEQGR